MPNRIIKESICTSEEIDGLSPEAEVLFYRLMVKCDDFGLYFANPKIISGTCFPLKQPKEAAVAGWMRELVAAGLIFVYTADSKDYLKLASWEKHQQTRAQKSKFPLPISSDSKCNQAQSNVPVIVNENDNVIVNDNVNDNVCAEQAPAPPPEPPVISLPLNDKTEYPITQTQVDEWRELYPAVDVMQELRKYVGWAKSNPTKRKTRRGILRSVTSWLSKEQDRGGARASPNRKKLDGLKYDQRPPGENGLDKDFDDMPSKKGG